MKLHFLSPSPNGFRRWVGVLCTLAWLTLSSRAPAQQLIHRYSFDADALDLVGGADGELVGDATIADGAVVLSGNKPSYVNLPNDLVMGLNSASFEAWVTWRGGTAWQRIWDFGNSGTEDIQAAASASVFLSPDNGGGMQLSIFPTTAVFGQQVLNAPRLSIGQLHHIVWTYDDSARTGILYLDGIQIAINPSMTAKPSDLGSTVNNWLGHSQYVQDADFAGSIAEFRIYDGPLSAATVATNFLVGPDPTGRGALVSLSLVANSVMRPGAVQQLRVSANYEHISGVDITSEPAVSYEVSDPAVFAVSAGGLLTSVGTSAATASVTARYLGKSAQRDVQVTPQPPAVLVHRYSFDADANDLVGLADGELVGDATIASGAVILSGNKPSYVNLPNDLVIDLNSATFEVWVTWNGGPQWQRIWDFGNSGGEDNQTAAAKSIFLTPDNGGGMQLSIFTSPGAFGRQLLNAPRLSIGQLHHVVWTYDDLVTTGILYLDGTQIAINRNMASRLSDLGSTFNNWLGHSQYPDADFAGSIAEFRIYDGALSASQVATNSIVGPDPSGRGFLVSVSLTARPVMLAGGKQPLQVKADFEHVAGVDITGDPGVTFTVGDGSVFSVSPGGLLVSVGSVAASSTATAKYQDKQGSQDIQVILPTPAVLIHRYSFTFPSDASDSIGGADGSLVGDASTSGGALVLSGVKPSYVNFPNTLLDGLTDVTLELWLTWNGGAIWQRIIDFGNSTSGEDSQGAATQSIFLTPNNGGFMDLSIFPNGIAGQQVINGTPLTPNVPHHIVWTYARAATTSRLFVDGVENGVNLAMTYTLADLLPLYNVWLGHSQYVQDADFAGTISEFRVYQGTFTDADVTADIQAGPDALPSEFAIRKLAVRVSSGAAIVSWPVAAGGFVLESAADLGPGAVWTLVDTQPVANGDRNEVTLPGAPSTRFFRLKK